MRKTVLPWGKKLAAGNRDSQDILVVQEIAQGKNKAGRYSAAVGAAWFFDSGGVLCKMTREQIQKAHATLDDAERIPTPEGEMAGLMALGDILVLALREPSGVTLYARGGTEDWLLVSSLPLSSPIESWCVSEKKNYLFFCESAPATPPYVVYALDQDRTLTALTYDVPVSGRQVFFLAQWGAFLYLAFSSSQAIFQTSIVDDEGKLMSEKHLEFERQPLPFTPFRLLPAQKGKFLFAGDGDSTVYEKDGKPVFSDTSSGDSGYQIAGAAFFSGARNYHILGSWRRSQEHPVACLYVLKNLKPVYKYREETPFAKGLEWTGFQSFNGSLHTREDAFFPCQGGAALYVRRISAVSEKKGLRGLTGFSVTYEDEDTLIFEHTKSGKAVTDRSSPDWAAWNGYCFPRTSTAPTRIYLTFDVEQHKSGPPYCLTGQGLEEECGVYWIMDQLEKFGLKGVFFVNIYEHVNFADGLIEKIVKDIDARGHEVGLHCHSSSLPFNSRSLPECTREEQRVILAYGKEFLERLLGKAPVSFRAGAYAMNNDTLEILEELGLKVDSSVFAALLRSDLTYRTKNRPVRYGELLEIPVTTHALYGNLSKIDINWHPNADLLSAILLACRRHGLNDLVFMGHSFSFLEWTRNPEESPYDFSFTGQRYIRGVNFPLMEIFSRFLSRISQHPDFSVLRFCDSLLEPDMGHSRDVIPYLMPPSLETVFCPVCGKQVRLEPYRGRKNALCPVCRSLERVRFKYLYLKLVKQVESAANLSVLHIGPNIKISSWLKSLPNLDYISVDPFSEADFKFSAEAIPFIEDSFDLVICIGVLMHVLDDAKVLRETHRVLRSGGELLLWLGSLDCDVTEEYYDRKEFDKMVAHDFSRPEDIARPTVVRKDGKIFYNPRFATRRYGRDVIGWLSACGFSSRLVYAREVVQEPQLHGISNDDVLLACRKEKSPSAVEGGGGAPTRYALT